MLLLLLQRQSPIANALRTTTINASLNASLKRTFLSFSNDIQTYRIKRVVRNRPDVLYSVVADVESYSQFIPFCEHSVITDTDPESGVPRRAVLQVGWNHINERFESELKFSDQIVIVSDSTDSPDSTRLTD